MPAGARSPHQDGDRRARLSRRRLARLARKETRFGRKRMNRVALVALSALHVGCSVYETNPTRGGTNAGAGGGGGGGVGPGTGGSEINVLDASYSLDGPLGGAGRDPVTCEEAAQFRTYLGCEYFPTILGNVVSPEFDFAVIVANTSDES